MSPRLPGVLVVLAFLVPASAEAATFKVSVAPEVASYPETKELTYRVEITTTVAERVSIHVGGNGLVTPEQATLEGPGTIGPVTSTHGDPFGCANYLGFREFHHLMSYSWYYTLELPQDSVSTLVFRAQLSPDAPLPGEDYRLSLDVPGGAPVVPAIGPKGVAIRIAMDPPTDFCGSRQIRGVPITVTGTTDPRLAGDEMTLLLRHQTSFQYVSTPPAERELARVKVEADGTFALRDWRPQETGTYAIQARYTSTRPDIANDFSVPLGFQLRTPAPIPEAQRPRPTATIPGLATVLPTVKVRRGVARIRLRCSRSEPCRGIVRLKVRKNFTQWHNFRIAPGSEKAVSIRLGPSVRRALRKRALDAAAHVRLNDAVVRTPVKLRAA